MIRGYLLRPRDAKGFCPLRITTHPFPVGKAFHGMDTGRTPLRLLYEYRITQRRLWRVSYYAHAEHISTITENILLTTHPKQPYITRSSSDGTMTPRDLLLLRARVRASPYEYPHLPSQQTTIFTECMPAGPHSAYDTRTKQHNDATNSNV